VELPPGLLGLGEPIDDARSAGRLLREVLQRGLIELTATIPGEKLATLLRLHRNTMSKVFQDLAEEGYLHRRRGRSPRVAAHRSVLPKGHIKRVSHTALARDHGLEMRSRPIATQHMRVAQLEEAYRARVSDRLKLDELEDVLVHSRIREIRESDGVWVPAIAETAYFAAMRVPQLAEALAAPDGLNSVHEFLLQKAIDPVTGAYEVRAGNLPEPFVQHWVRLANRTPSEVASLPFLRFDSTTHGHVGAIEFSIAYFHGAYFSLATTDVVLKINSGAVLSDALRGKGAVSTTRGLRAGRTLETSPARRRAAR